MRPAVLIIAVAALATTSANLKGLDYLWTGSEGLKVMESCLGKNVTELVLKNVQKAFDGCYNASSLDNFHMPVDSLEFFNFKKLFDDFAANKTKGSDKKELYAPLVDTLRCVFKGVKLTDDNNGLNVAAIVQGYKAMNLSPTLLANFLAAVDQCYELAQCFPLERSDDSRIPSDLVQLHAYVTCELYLRNWACLKNDLKNNAASCEIDFSSSDKILNKLPDEAAHTIAAPNTE